MVAHKFGEPRDFIVALRSLFEDYADLTFRINSMRRPSVVLPEYHLSPVILRTLEKELGRYCEDNPLASLDVIDLLWKEPRREPRILAAALLGKIPLSHSQAVITRLLSWSAVTEEYALAKTIVGSASLNLRTEAPEEWIGVLSNWLNSRSDIEISLGLTGLIPLIQDRSFVDIPRVFDLLTPHLDRIDPHELTTLQSIIESLARRTPKETVFVLKQIAGNSRDANLFRLLRRCLPEFPEEQRISLRYALAKGSQLAG